MIHGRVIHGRHLGTTLGFPTVNIEPREQKHLPAFGVYLSKVVIDGNIHNGITNIGRKAYNRRKNTRLEWKPIYTTWMLIFMISGLRSD